MESTSLSDHSDIRKINQNFINNSNSNVSFENNEIANTSAFRNKEMQDLHYNSHQLRLCLPFNIFVKHFYQGVNVPGPL